MNYNQKDKEASELADKLSNIKKEELLAVLPKIPEYINSEYELVRVESVELVGDFELKQFLKEIKAALKDESELVRKYALTSLYDLIKADSTPYIEESLNDSHPEVVTTAIPLLYIITEDEKLLNHLVQVLEKNDWNSNLCSTIYNTFERYIDVIDYQAVVIFLSTMLTHLDEKDYLHKEISSKIR